MKFVIAQMQHETNTFSPIPTPWEAFGNHGPLIGREAFDAIGGFDPSYFMYSEEIDLCYRFKAAGWSTARGRCASSAFPSRCAPTGGTRP